jgi:hypothetical protein
MKKIIFVLSLITVLICAKAQNAMSKWPELKAFHDVMSQTFHPSEEGNLQPIKERSKELATKASALSKSNIPNEFKNDKVKKTFLKLAEDSKKLNKQIEGKKISDADIIKSLNSLHDVFHQIVGLCNKENEN